jgi:hypothetical protein
VDAVLTRVRYAEIAARADYKHNLFMDGDPRGFYGQYPPPPTA